MGGARSRGQGEAPSVRWRGWSEEAFAEAREQGKLVFLDLSASWCHWCHVLDRTSLSDPRVVELLNESFVPVRVDTDRRPDVNDRYNQGGWPTIAVLFPDGRILTGATFLPPDALLSVLSRCLDFYRRDRPRIEEYLRGADEVKAGEEDAGGEPPPGPRPEDLALVRAAVLGVYDPAFPGFFEEPKFLMTDILAFLRDCWICGSDAEAGSVFLTVLRTMAGSAVWDPADGGFFRYATRRDWTAPHYEKLLPDNAEMLSLCASAYARTKEAVFAAAAEGILRFLFERLYDRSAGVFFASRDSDEHYYALSAGERALRLPPPADTTVISEYNAKAVSALCAAHRVFGAAKEIAAEGVGSLLDRALRLGAFLRKELWSDRDGQIRFRDGETVFAGHLSDNVAAAAAYLDLFEAAADPAHLEWAAAVLDWAIRRFYSPSRFGFLDRRPGNEEAAALAAPLLPFGWNAAAAAVLLRCGRAAGRTDFLAVGRQTLRGLSAEFGGRGAFAASYGSALVALAKADSGPACMPGVPSCGPKGEAAG